jgi:hypothetical protein
MLFALATGRTRAARQYADRCFSHWPPVEPGLRGNMPTDARFRVTSPPGQPGVRDDMSTNSRCAAGHRNELGLRGNSPTNAR